MRSCIFRNCIDSFWNDCFGLLIIDSIPLYMYLKKLCFFKRIFIVRDSVFQLKNQNVCIDLKNLNKNWLCRKGLLHSFDVYCISEIKKKRDEEQKSFHYQMQMEWEIMSNNQFNDTPSEQDWWFLQETRQRRRAETFQCDSTTTLKEWRVLFIRSTWRKWVIPRSS